jgi:hypothetical protein
MAKAGRPSEVDGVDILDRLHSLEFSHTTTSHVAKWFGCSKETARRKLEALAEKDALNTDTTSGTTIWYLPDESSESVVPFVSRSLLAVVEGSPETIDAADRLCEEMASYHQSRIYKYNYHTVSLPDCRTEGDVRDVAKQVSSYPPFVDDILSRWWQHTDVLFFSDDDSGKPILQTETPEKLHQLRKLIDVGDIEEEQSDRTLVLNPENIVDVVNRFHASYSIKDRRDPQLMRHEILQPIYNGSIDELSYNFELLGVDKQHAAHVFDRADNSLKVISDGSLDSTHEAVSLDDDTLRDWFAYVDDKLGWIEWRGP